MFLLSINLYKHKMYGSFMHVHYTGIRLKKEGQTKNVPIASHRTQARIVKNLQMPKTWPKNVYF